MIYVCITGRLGNQMFQYAIARQISALTGQSITLNIYYLKKFTSYEFQLNIFNLCKCNNLFIEDKKPMPFFANLMFYPTKLLRKIFPNIYRKVVSYFGGIVDMSMVYHDFDLNHKNYYLLGYFQSESYFKNIREELLSDFSLLEKDNVAARLFNLIYKINSTESVCISVRRGDYVSNKKIKDKFFICDETYFKNAVNLIKSKKKNCVLFVFSDEPMWAKDNLKFDCETYYEPMGLNIKEKIFLMSSCKNFILSNSSFSWRVQYLSKNEDKIVIAPKKWFPKGDPCSIYELQSFLYV